MARRTQKHRSKVSARNADRFRLYEQSVQDPERDIALIQRIFRRRRGRVPLSLREDFCGTAALCTSWAASRRDRTATGVDNDREVLEWGRWNNLAPLGDDAWRVTLRHQDVRDAVPGRFDVTVGFNYSYCILKTRQALRDYFRSARRSLKPDGILFLDAHGGWEATMPLLEERRENGFVYIWDQDRYNPIDGSAQNYIHFRFDDGTELKRAFSYEWRIWQLVDLRELLEEVGFRQVDVYWEEDDDEGANGAAYRRRTRVENDPAWNCYLVAER